MQKLKNAMTAAFERAWLGTENRRAIKQGIRIIEMQEKQQQARAARRQQQKGAK